MQYSCSRKPDIEALLEKSLSMNLTGEAPSVLIIHTHGTEAFTPTEGMEYAEDGGAYRTTDDRVNMISLGEELARLLQAAGINVIHDRTYYDYPDYEASYDLCREGLAEQLKQYPSIRLVVDLHRDAAEYGDGTQWATSATVNGEESAQVMLVMGTDCYYEHPKWEENLSVALKLQVLMEKEHPGVTRPLDLRKQRFNQDLSTGAIIAEIGAAGNTHQQAMNGVSVLAEAIIRLADETSA
jgi:stage II sporulation protein P